MNSFDLASPLLPDGADSVATFESTVPPPDTGAPFVVAHPPARVIRRLAAHLARRVELAVQARTSARRRRLRLTSMAWPAGSGNRQGLPARLRSAVLGGALHVYAPPNAPSVLEAVLAETAAIGSAKTRFGSGGGLRVRTEVTGRPAILRLGRVGTPADPTRHHAGLRAAAPLPEVPTALGRGRVGDVAWTAESFVRGTTQTRADDARLMSVTRFLSSLPTADSIKTPFNHIELLARIAGEEGDSVRRIGERTRRQLTGLPGSLIHGDFWLGNLLFRGTDLVAVVDWDGWEPAGPPGTDLLHFFADLRRRRSRTNYGFQVEEQFWRNPEVRRLLDEHLTGRGIPTDDITVDALGTAWWLTAVATAVARNTPLGEDTEWVEGNLRRAARAMIRGGS